MPPEAHEDDVRILSQMLTAISLFLELLLDQEDRFTYQEDLSVLRGTYDAAVLQPVREIRRQLREMTDQQREALRNAGLTGPNLQMKWTLLGFDVKRGRVKRIIKRINSILGSLSSVFPVADVIKEFKDQTEASMGDLDDSEGPKSLGDLGGRFW
jgi:hypothetical protein